MRCEDCRKPLDDLTGKHKHPKPPDYKYEALPRQRSSIRILVLFASSPDNPQIECELLATEFQPDGALDMKYEALSWCWGTAKQNSYINIRKGGRMYAKYVSPDLKEALKALRYRKKDRYLWIDAICINQKNFPEKNHQVEMMSTIYGQAKNVCIWLGEGDKSSSISLNFIKKEVLQLQNFDELCESEEASSKWGALLELMQRPWFSRRWVVQELALARKAMIYCGSDKIPWKDFAVAVELFVEVETATHRLSEVMKKDPKYYHVPGWFEYVSALGASLLVEATGSLFRAYSKVEGPMASGSDGKSRTHSKSRDDSKSKSGSKSIIDSISETDSESEIDSESEAGSDSGTESIVPSTKSQPLLSLEYLVSSLSIFEATVGHDTVYALLAIARDTTPFAGDLEAGFGIEQTQEYFEMFQQRKRYKVDYEQPYADVCKTFVEFCIQQSDPTRALDIICRPWAAEDKTNAARRNLGTELTIRNDGIPLPSWIPQLSGASYAMYSQAGVHTLKMGRKNADTLVGLPSSVQRNYNAAEIRGIDLNTLKFRKRMKKKHYSMYVKGFVLDTVAEVLPSSQGGAIPQEWTDAGGWKNAPNTDPPDEFWRTLVADRGRDGRNPPVYYSRACKESFLKGGLVSGSVSTTDLINNERCSVVAQFCRRVQAVIWNRSLIKTKNGNLGLVSRNVREGDLVCILYGCSVPVILRKNDLRKTDIEVEEERVEDMDALIKTFLDNWGRRFKRTKMSREGREKKKLEEGKKEKERTGQQSDQTSHQKKERKDRKDRKNDPENDPTDQEPEQEKDAKRKLGATEIILDFRKKVAEAKAKEEVAAPKNENGATDEEGVKDGKDVKDVQKDSKLMEEGVYWFHESLSECYIHGMMDGEAMALQNTSGISTQAFEIR
jgi:hypothetical protein